LGIKAARFPGHKTLKDFNFDHQPNADWNLLAHLGTRTFITKAKNVVLLGPPDTGKTHLAVALGIPAAKQSSSIRNDTLRGCAFEIPPTALTSSQHSDSPSSLPPQIEFHPIGNHTNLAARSSEV
jgi:hypothetical protein